jgi:hypothetical protein
VGADRWQHLPVRTQRAGFQLEGVEVERLEQVFDFARSLWHRTFDVAGAPLVFEFQRVRHGGRVLYDGAPLFIESMRENLEALRSGGEDRLPNQPWNAGYEPLSLVGTVVSFEVSGYGSSAGGPPACDETWTCLDLATGKPPDPLELFDEASLVTAMKADSCFGAALTPREKATLTRFADLVAAFEASKMPQDNCFAGGEAFSRVAVLGYDARRDVATRSMVSSSSCMMGSEGRSGRSSMMRGTTPCATDSPVAA